MSILATIANKLGFVPKEKAEAPLTDSFGGDLSALLTGGNAKKSITAALQQNQNWVYACIKAIAEDVAAMQFELYQVDAKGDYERVWDHPILDLIQGANPFITGYELLYRTASHLELAGNTYWYLEGMTTEKSKPTAIYPLTPKYVTIKRGDKANEPVLEYIYQAGAKKKQPYKPYEILHIKYPDPNDDTMGIGTVQAIATWIEADNNASEYNRRFFANGARPGALLKSTKARTQVQIDILRDSFSEKYAGIHNTNRPLVLPDNTEFEKLEWSNSDIQFGEMLKITRDNIMAGFRVPRTALGITDDVNRANAEATDYVFAARTIKPKMAMICNQLNEKLVPLFGDNLVLTFTDPTPENRELKIREMQAAVADAPTMSINEAREEYFGLPAVDNGDAVMTDFTKIPLGKPTDKHAGKGRAKRTDLAPAHNPERKNKAKITESKSEAARAIAEAVKEAAAAAAAVDASNRSKSLEDMTDDEFEVMHKQFVARVTPYETGFKDAIVAFNDKQKKEVLENLEAATKEVDPAKLFNLGAWVDAMVDLATPFMLTLYESEAIAAAALLGQNITNFLTDEAKQGIERATRLFAEKYNQTTADLLKAKLEANQAAGADLNALKDTVDGIYGYSNDVRAAMVARTETFRVGNAATQAAWEQSGVVKSKKWYTAADERVCEFCGPMHGTKIDIGGRFFDKGTELGGEDGGVLPLNYDDVDFPPLHVNCRCYIRPADIEV